MVLPGDFGVTAPEGCTYDMHRGLLFAGALNMAVQHLDQLGVAALAVHAVGG